MAASIVDSACGHCSGWFEVESGRKRIQHGAVYRTSCSIWSITSHHYLNDSGAAVLLWPSAIHNTLHSSCIVHEHCTLLHHHCMPSPQKTVYVYGWVGMDYMHLNEGCVASFLVC